MVNISVKNISVRYSNTHTNLSLRRSIISLFRSKFKAKANVTANNLAVNNVSFELLEGDRLALIGGNGAGKTTLLKTLSGMYEPSAGSISINGTKSSFIELSAGMDFGLSGEKNVELHFLMRGHEQLGLDLDLYVKNVRDFSDLGDSFYLPVNTYSSGMFVRLSFAMVTEVCPQILLLDEWLSAGDMFFMEQANKRMEELAETARIMVLATHSADLAVKWCTKALVLTDTGSELFDDVPDALKFYQASQ